MTNYDIINYYQFTQILSWCISHRILLICFIFTHSPVSYSQVLYVSFTKGVLIGIWVSLISSSITTTMYMMAQSRNIQTIFYMEGSFVAPSSSRSYCGSSSPSPPSPRCTAGCILLLLQSLLDPRWPTPCGSLSVFLGLKQPFCVSHWRHFGAHHFFSP